MTSRQIRQQFLDFFASKGHAIVDSSPVVPPADDASLKDTFTNAGMNQFKDLFLGTGSRTYKRAADTQKCIRAGGKHNDLDDVGQDTYHHTFFEMLGNWSFGDYFKKEAIEWAWELLTVVWGIEKDRLHATYFEGDPVERLDADTEAAKLWKTVTDIDPSHVHPGGKKDNFWEMGDTGPCGPCSEIHIDLTPDKSGGSLVNAGDARVIELWNLVFIQYNRSSDGRLAPLPARHVDTGMGFERLCAVLQGMHQGRIGQVSNYDTDVFTPIFEAIRKRTGAPAYRGTLPSTPCGPPEPSRLSACDAQAGDRNAAERGAPVSNRRTNDQTMIDVSYRVIADHLRCLTFAITDGALPGNDGRGYVLRRILRRAVRYGRQYLDMHEPFLCDLVPTLVDHMAGAFPELRTAHGGRNVEHVAELIRDEEASFLKTLDRGIKLFNEAADTARRHHDGKISGEDAFKLHDTYGFPIDLTEQMAEEQGLTIDIGEYERLMEEAREKARATSGVPHQQPDNSVQQFGRTVFCGYEHLKVAEATVWGFHLGPVSGQISMHAGQTGGLVLDKTPFYAEQGGQVGDVGVIEGVSDDWLFVVENTQRVGETFVHWGRCDRGTIRPHDMGGIPPTQNPTMGMASASVDTIKRRHTMNNHTATHLLNWALREVLCAPDERENPDVQQKGSLVDPEKTRFDFSHNKPLTDDELARIESLVNEKIASDLPVYTKEVDQEKARQINTLRAVFGEKYPHRVRVVSIGADIDAMLADPKNPEWMKYSVEFCGGTHLKTSREAECFVIVSEEGVAKGVRRVVGVTADAARLAVKTGEALLAEAHDLEKLRNRPEPRDAQDGTNAVEGKGAVVRANSNDFPAAVASFQQKVNEAVIPVRVRHQLRDRIATLQQQAKDQQKRAASASAEAVREAVKALLAGAETVDGVTIVVGEVPAAGADALRGAIDWIRNKVDTSAVLLAASSDDKVTLIAGMSKTAVDKGLKAGDLIREIAPLVGGRGGGRPDMAQGGGSDAGGIPSALERARTHIRDKLS